MRKSRFFILTVPVLFIFTSALSATVDSRWLVPRSLIEPTELKIVWQFNLPFSESETLEQFFVADSRLCVLSSRNYLACLNRADSNVIFGNYITTSGLPVGGLEFYKGELMTVVGNKLIEINADFGTEKTPINVSGGVTCPVVRNDSFIYIAGNDNRLHALRAEDHVQVFEAAAENGSQIISVLADQDFVIFATKDGNVVCIGANKPRKLWQFDAPLAISGELVRDEKSLYFACRDTNIYKLELSAGQLLWKYQTEAVLEISPQVGKKTVYQHVPHVGVIALNKEAGKPIWKVADGMGLSSELNDKAFIVTKAGTVAAMDNLKAKQLYSIDIGQPIKFAANYFDSKIYIADEHGRLTCLQPVE